MESVLEKLEKKVENNEKEISENGKNKDSGFNLYQINSEMAFSLDEAKQRLSTLKDFIQEIMIDGTDYGSLPNTEKRCLFKSGAEKLCDIFGFSKKIEIVSRVENFEKGIFHYEVKAILINKRSGLVEAEGIGCCNNMEKKYKSQDAYSVVNTVLKMAKKRAFIDAVLSATRSSDIFTQDLEDESLTRSTYVSKNSTNQSNEKIIEDYELASKKQISYIFTLLSQNKIPLENARKTMMSRYKISESKKLTKEQATDFIEFLKDYKEHPKAV